MHGLHGIAFVRCCARTFHSFLGSDHCAITIGFMEMEVIKKCVYFRFPMEHFGMLHGVMFAVTGATLAVQYGYVRWVEAAGFTPVSIHFTCNILTKCRLTYAI